MKSIYKNLAVSFIGLMLLFALFRSVFYMVYFRQIADDGAVLAEVLASFYHALSLDAAMAALYLIIPWVLLVLYSLVRLNFFIRLLQVYLLLVVGFHTFVMIAELGVYGEWSSKPSYQILMYLRNVSEIVNSVPLSTTIFLLSLAFLSLFIAYQFISRLVIAPKQLETRQPVWLVLFYIVIPLVIVIVGRGGFSQIPISTSDVFFSKKQIINDATVNTSYQFIHSVIEHQELISGENPYQISADITSPALLKPMLNQSCVAPKIFKKSKVNVVLVLLESWSADVIETGGGSKGLTPNFEKLIQEGVYFTQAYGVGMLSHDGIPAVLSGFPKIPKFHITDEPKKYKKLANLTSTLKTQAAYDTSFLFGGQLRYGNIKSYIFNNNFDEIFEEKDFPSHYPSGRLGIPDEYIFDYFVQRIDKRTPPFFSVAYTLSSHSPYDQPMEQKINWGGRDKGYLNSIYYSDYAVGKLIEKAKSKPWYKDTVFVFVADHSHIVPQNWKRNQAERRRIPILFYGDPIKEAFKGKIYNKVVSQIDIASTLLGQLGIDSSHFTWSQNILCDSYQPMAYYSLTDKGFGLITDKGYLTYDYTKKKVGYKKIKEDNKKVEDDLLLKGKNYLDFLFKSYLGL